MEGSAPKAQALGKTLRVCAEGAPPWTPPENQNPGLWEFHGDPSGHPCFISGGWEIENWTSVPQQSRFGWSSGGDTLLPQEFPQGLGAPVQTMQRTDGVAPTRGQIRVGSISRIAPETLGLDPDKANALGHLPRNYPGQPGHLDGRAAGIWRHDADPSTVRPGDRVEPRAVRGRGECSSTAPLSASSGALVEWICVGSCNSSASGCNSCAASGCNSCSDRSGSPCETSAGARTRRTESGTCLGSGAQTSS